jgi:hypothetical protein
MCPACEGRRTCDVRGRKSEFGDLWQCARCGSYREPGPIHACDRCHGTGWRADAAPSQVATAD